jgi:hypothetical protein
VVFRGVPKGIPKLPHGKVSKRVPPYLGSKFVKPEAATLSNLQFHAALRIDTRDVLTPRKLSSNRVDLCEYTDVNSL